MIIIKSKIKNIEVVFLVCQIVVANIYLSTSIQQQINYKISRLISSDLAE